MWYENFYVDGARQVLGVPLSPLWIASSAEGHEVGIASRPVRGHVYVFSSMCAFLSAESTTLPTVSAATALLSADEESTMLVSDRGNSASTVEGPTREKIVFRVHYASVESVVAEGEQSIRMVSQGCVYVLRGVEERAAVMRALQWVVDHQFVAEDSDEVQRSSILYPVSTRKVQSLQNPQTTVTSQNSPSSSVEYVVQEIDGAIVTNQRLMFATTVVRLSSIQMMHVGAEELKIIINDDLVVQMRCSAHRQALVSSVWLASLPIWTDLLGRVAEDPQKALKAHVKTLSRLHRQFCAIDVSRDGKLSKDEVRHALGCLFSTLEFVESFFEALDADHSNEITLVEFLSGIARLLTSDVLGRIRFTFDMMDRDHSGFLDRHELCLALRSLSSTGDVRVIREEDIRLVCDALFERMSTDDAATDLISRDDYLRAMETEPEVRSMFRRIGFYDDCDFLHTKLSEEPLTAASPTWRITTAVMQTLLQGLQPSIVKRDTDRSILSFEPHWFQAREVDTINVPLDVVRNYGHEWAGGRIKSLLSDEQWSHLLASRLAANASNARNETSGLIQEVGSCEEIESLGATADLATELEASTVILQTLGPAVFEGIRALHGIETRRLKRSLGVDNVVANALLGSATLLRFITPLFSEQHKFKFISHDGDYLIRHLDPEEFSRIATQLPMYVAHLVSNPNSLMQRYLGIFSLYSNGFQLHFAIQLNGFRGLHRYQRMVGGPHNNPSVLMRDLLPVDGRVMITFQCVPKLSGLGENATSSRGAICGGIDAASLRCPIAIPKLWRDILLRQLGRDIRFLTSMGATDYAILAAIPAQIARSYVNGTGSVGGAQYQLTDTSLMSIIERAPTTLSTVSSHHRRSKLESKKRPSWSCCGSKSTGLKLPRHLVDAHSPSGDAVTHSSYVPVKPQLLRVDPNAFYLVAGASGHVFVASRDLHSQAGLASDHDEAIMSDGPPIDGGTVDYSSIHRHHGMLVVPLTGGMQMSFAFVNTLCSPQNVQSEDCETYGDQLMKLFQDHTAPAAAAPGTSAERAPPQPEPSFPSGASSVDLQWHWLPVSLESGQVGALGWNIPLQEIWLRTARGETILSVCLGVGNDHEAQLQQPSPSHVHGRSLHEHHRNHRDISFARDASVCAEEVLGRSRCLQIRSGLYLSRNGIWQFTDSFRVYFESAVTRQTFLEGYFSGMQCCADRMRHRMLAKACPPASVAVPLRKSLRLFTVTWNVDERLPGDVHELMQRALQENCDVIAFHTQDCSFPVQANRDVDCETQCAMRVAICLAPHYSLVASTSVWSTRTTVFVRNDWIHGLSNVTMCGTGTFIGSCNAVAVGLSLFDTSICFVNARYAQRGDAKSSTANFSEVVEGLSHDLEPSVNEAGDILSRYHHVMFCGDLKYRHAASFAEIIAAAQLEATLPQHAPVDNDSMPRFSRLVATDQLVVEMSAGSQVPPNDGPTTWSPAYPGFTEAPITFGPTTKMLLDEFMTEGAFVEQMAERMLATSRSGALEIAPADLTSPVQSPLLLGPESDRALSQPADIASHRHQQKQQRVYDEIRSQSSPPTWSHRILYHSAGHELDSATCMLYDADNSLRSGSNAAVFAVHELSLRRTARGTSPTSSRSRHVIALRITNLQCHDLRRAEGLLGGVCDPQVRIAFPLSVRPFYTSPAIRGSCNPVWDDPIVVALQPSCKEVWVMTKYLRFVVQDASAEGAINLVGSVMLPMDWISCCPSSSGRLLCSKRRLPLERFGLWNGFISFDLEVLQ